MHLMRCSGTVSLAAAACSMDVLRVWGRYVLCFFVMFCLHMHAERACRQHINCWLLEEQKVFLGNNMSRQGNLCDSIKHIVDVKHCLLEVDKPLKNIVVSLWFCLTASKQGFMTSHTV